MSARLAASTDMLKVVLAAVAGAVVLTAMAWAGLSTRGQGTEDVARDVERAVARGQMPAAAPEPELASWASDLCDRIKTGGREVQVQLGDRTYCDAIPVPAEAHRVATGGPEVIIKEETSTLHIVPLSVSEVPSGVVAVRAAAAGSAGFRAPLAGLVLVGALLAGIAGYLFGAGQSQPQPAAAPLPPVPRTSSVPRPVEVSDPRVAAQRRELALACIELRDMLPSEALRLRLSEALRKAGIRELDPRGQVFDPHRHKAVDVVPTTDPSQAERIESTFRAGYEDNSEVLRIPEVRVYRATER
jgi:hypothetical protein